MLFAQTFTVEFPDGQFYAGGVDVFGEILMNMAGEVVTGLGAVVAVIVAAFFAFLLIRKALRWARSGF